MLNSSSPWQELIKDGRGFALCSPPVRIAIAQPCPAFSSSGPSLPGPFPAAQPQAPLLPKPSRGRKPSRGGGGDGAQAPGVRNVSHLEERRHLHARHFQSNRGRGAPSLPPGPASTLALTGLLRENWVLVRGGIASVSANPLTLLAAP